MGKRIESKPILMSEKLKLGLLQFSTGPEKDLNLERVKEKIDGFKDRPDIVTTPEYLMGLENGEISKEILRKNSEPLDSNFVKSLKEEAKENGISILFTTYREEEGYFNSSVFVDENGKIKGVYDKIHLFDAFDHKESDFFRRGNEVVVFNWKNIRIGLATCFDLRFPELFRIMRFKGADIILVPSGFYTGEHKTEQWRTLISSRAHEDNLFVVGVNQPEPHFVGNSMVASPLGDEVRRLGKKEEMGMVEIDLKVIDKAKRKMPIKKLLRPDLYSRYDPYKSEKRR